MDLFGSMSAQNFSLSFLIFSKKEMLSFGCGSVTQFGLSFLKMLNVTNVGKGCC
jgi:hypothetical protein